MFMHHEYVKRQDELARDVRTGVYGKLKKTELKRKVACCLLHSLSRSVEYLVILLN